MEMAILMTQILDQSDENFFNCTSILRDVLLRKNAFFWILSKLPTVIQNVNIVTLYLTS